MQIEETLCHWLSTETDSKSYWTTATASYATFKINIEREASKWKKNVGDNDTIKAVQLQKYTYAFGLSMRARSREKKINLWANVDQTPKGL